MPDPADAILSAIRDAIGRPDDYAAVMTALNNLIRGYLNRGASQQYQPDGSPDLADHLTADSLKRAARLRKLRDEFEEIVSGAILDDKTRSPLAMVPPDPREP